MLILSTPLLQITQRQILFLSCPLLLHRPLALMDAYNECLLELVLHFPDERLLQALVLLGVLQYGLMLVGRQRTLAVMI